MSTPALEQLALDITTKDADHLFRHGPHRQPLHRQTRDRGAEAPLYKLPPDRPRSLQLPAPAHRVGWSHSRPASAWCSA
ncbi:hypothetical protein QJS66_12330 [Kocuria rhizophila]|nr:hypothetical protein QJS66_12330 [Kocuria rhizophila]